MKRILITGAGSYIGSSVHSWLNQWPEKYEVSELDMVMPNWSEFDFTGYDAVFHVAGIAHRSASFEKEQAELYYSVNRDLAVRVAGKAKEAGVNQFILMSSMSVYGGSGVTLIMPTTSARPNGAYGDSKLQAEHMISILGDERFKVAILRPPMVYGKNCPGNFANLVKLTSKLLVFPKVENKRSVLFIDNLAEFVRLLIDDESSGIFFPQDDRHVSTSDLAMGIAASQNKKLLLLPGGQLMTNLLARIPGKVGRLAKKAFGDMAYDLSMSHYSKPYCLTSTKSALTNL